MRARKLIIETLLKEATEEEKLVASALDDAFDELEADLKANKDKLAPEMQNEAVGFAIAGSIVSLPALLKLIGKAVAKVQSKLKGENVDTNTIIKVADKLHHLLIGGVEKVLQVVFRIKDKKQAHRLAVIIFHAIVAGLLIASGKAFFKALQKHNTIMSVLEGLLSAIKSGELGVFLIETFGEIAEALGLGAELADAADLADAIEAAEELSEISTMAGGSVQGYSLPLGAKPEDYKMENKLRITKGRLRQILAEEVARHQKQKLNEMTMAERGMVDAKDGNPPTKIGQGNEEYMKAYNAVMKKMGKDPLPMKQPDQAYLDALRSGRLEEMGAAEEAAEADELAAEALEEGRYSLAGREGFLQGRRAAEDDLSPEKAEAKAKERALAMSGRALDMLQLTGLESASPEQYELAMKDALEASATATRDYLTQFYEGYISLKKVSEEKTEKYDDEMEKAGFSPDQANKLPDGLQKAMLQTEVRAMIEEMLNEEMLCEECGGVHEGTCPEK